MQKPESISSTPTRVTSLQSARGEMAVETNPAWGKPDDFLMKLLITELESARDEKRAGIQLQLSLLRWAALRGPLLRLMASLVVLVALWWMVLTLVGH